MAGHNETITILAPTNFGVRAWVGAGAELGKSTFLDGWFAKTGLNGPMTNRVKV